MYSSTIMRSIVLFASLTSLPLFASAAPINVLEIYADGSMVERTVDEHEAYAGRPNGTSQWVKERSFEHDDGSLERRAAKDYTLDCKAVPEVCANICYYQHCKGGSLTQTPKSGRTVAPLCKKSPNKCSVLYKGAEGAYPTKGYQCDEFPMASTNEGGGANTATRCVPGGQNASSGGSFNAFPKGVAVKTVLLNTGSAPFYCDKKCTKTKDKNGRQD